jgi:hypothetical protein
MPPKTSFGYVEREADSYINWADIGKTITNTVDEIDRVRTEKKAAIDAAYKEGLKRINDTPQGENRVLNEFSINLGYNQAENLKIQNNLLKSGKINPKDFAVYLQNTTDDINSIYGTLSSIQEVFKEKQDRMKANQNQGIEVLDAVDLEKYGNFADLQTFSNINGKLSFGVTEEAIVDGQKVRKVKPGQENILSVDMLVGAMNRKYDRYDYVTDASGFVERLGESLMAYRTLGTTMKAGTITEIVDKTGGLDAAKAAAYGITDPKEIERLQKVVTDFQDAENKYIAAALSEYNMSSIITEELNYEATFDKTLAEKDPKKYMYAERQSNGSIKPMPTPDQVKEAKEFMRNQMRQMIDKKLEIKPYTDQAQYAPQPSSVQIGVGIDKEKAKQFGSIIRKFWEAGDADREAQLTALRGAEGVYDITMQKSGKQVFATITRKDKQSRPIPLTDENGNPVDIKNFGAAFGQWVYGNDIVTTYLKDFESTLEGGVYNPNYSPSTLNSGQIADLQAKIDAKYEAIEKLKKNNDPLSLADIYIKEAEINTLQKDIEALGGTTNRLNSNTRQPK